MHESIISQGGVVIKAYASPDEFKAWCAANRHSLNAEGRMAFSSFQAAQKIGYSHPAHKD
jgi:hypothetical protein